MASVETKRSSETSFLTLDSAARRQDPALEAGAVRVPRDENLVGSVYLQAAEPKVRGSSPLGRAERTRCVQREAFHPTGSAEAADVEGIGRSVGA
jgi:hypothetical protein